MSATENRNQRPLVETWDVVARSYSNELSQEDMNLAQEVEQIFRTAGIVPGMKVLELGSGSGHLSACLAQAGYTVSLLDFSSVALEKAKETFERNGLNGTFIRSDIFDLSEVEGSYDLVWNSGVMEHFNQNDFENILKSVKTHFGGSRFLFLVPNPSCRSYLMMRYNQHSRNNWAYGREYIRRDYQTMCEKAGFDIESVSYCSGEVSKYHFLSTFSNCENSAIYPDMMEHDLLPDDEKYLVAYLLRAKDTSDKEHDNHSAENCEAPDYQYEKMMELHAQVFGALRDKDAAIRRYEQLYQEKQEREESLIGEIEQLGEENAKVKRSLEQVQEENAKVKRSLEQVQEENVKVGRKLEQMSQEMQQLTVMIQKNKEQEELVERLQRENDVLSAQVHGLLTQKTTVIAQLYSMTRSRLFKLVHFLNRIKKQGFHKDREERKLFRRWLLSRASGVADEDHRYNPLFLPIEMLKKDLKDIPVAVSAQHKTSSQDTSINQWGSGVLAEYLQSQTVYFDEVKQKKMSKSAKKIEELVAAGNYKGILVYPHIVYWEPLQTPQQLLRAFAQEGWLCFFCDNPYQKDVFREVEPNLWICHEADLVQALADTPVTVLLTWMGSMAFLNELKNTKIWYHILDHLEIFSRYDELYQSLHDERIQQAEVVSYVARPLAECAGRTDAVYLPNGAHASEIANIHEGFVPDDMKDILARNHKIIGYYGYLAEWMDYQMVREMALARPEYEFVFIGKAVHDTSLIDRLPNVHLLGLKKYLELSDYAKFFDVATIPFVVDEKMDCVSPIKFYEYLALGLPVVSSTMTELIPFTEKCSFVECADGSEQFLKCIDKLLDEKIQEEAKKEAPLVAEANSWAARALEMEQYLLC